jgi:hypothetical protein
MCSCMRALTSNEQVDRPSSSRPHPFNALQISERLQARACYWPQYSAVHTRCKADDS